MSELTKKVQVGEETKTVVDWLDEVHYMLIDIDSEIGLIHSWLKEGSLREAANSTNSVSENLSRIKEILFCLPQEV